MIGMCTTYDSDECTFYIGNHKHKKDQILRKQGEGFASVAFKIANLDLHIKATRHE